MLTSNINPAEVEGFRPLEELVPAHWQHGTIEAADGFKIHYTRTGNGDQPALILLHGAQVNGLTWLRVAKAMEGDYDVIMPDFRGHGKTGLPPTRFTMDDVVSDMVRLIEALKLEKPFVIGHSMGGGIAGHLAAAYPLRGVVLVDPGLVNLTAMLPPMPDEGMPAYMQPIIETAKALKSMQHRERMAAGLKLMMPGAGVPHEEDYVTFVESAGEFDWNAYPSMMSLGYLFEQPEVIARIQCPVLLMSAQAMQGIDITPGVEAFKNHWREGEYVHFADAGHWIMSDQFERFVDVVRGFLKGDDV